VQCRLYYARIERAHGIRFAERFKPGGARRPGRPGCRRLVVLHPGGLELTDVGRLFVRNVAMVFDRHLSRADGTKSFSRTV
jgi:hypothetical protein